MQLIIFFQKIILIPKQTNFETSRTNSLNRSQNPFLFQNKTQNQNETSNNVFSNIIYNSKKKINEISTFNQNNFTINDIRNNNNLTNNPFLMGNIIKSQINNKNNNPFLTMNNNNGNNNISKSENPFITTKFNTKITTFNNNSKSSNNPFISN